MKNAMKKLMAFALVAVMLVGTLPFAAFADGEADPAAATPATYAVTVSITGAKTVSQNVEVVADVETVAKAYGFVATQHNINTSAFDATYSWNGPTYTGPVNPSDLIKAAGTLTVNLVCKHANTNVPAATCAVAKTCKDCGTELAAATGNHSWNEGSVKTEAKCYLAGEKLYTCTVCGTTKIESIPATGNHDWDNATCTEPAHCKTPGCQAVNGEERGHSLRETIITPADCDTAGQKRVECAFCDYEVTEPISALGHDIGSEGKCLRAGCGYTETNRYAVDFYLAYNNITTPTTKLVAAGTKVYDIYIPSRYGYDFAGWYTAAGVRVADNATVNSDSVYYARWTQVAPKEVYVRVYINGNTSNVYAIVDLYEWAQDHVITKADIEAAVAKYGIKANNKAGLSTYGPFTPAQWNSYCLDDYYRNPTERVDVDQDEKTVIYAMVHNVKTSSSSSSGNKADSSNPKTGDMIFAPMMVLGVSASALAALYYISKKRAI